MNERGPSSIRFGADGLAPAIVQDAATGEVLMLAFMNEESLRLTYETGQAHYWSRSRHKLWRKGETSGHEQVVTEIRINCEQNSLLLFVRQLGAVCHDGYPTCYYRRAAIDGSLTVVQERAFDPAAVYAPALSSTQLSESGPADRLAEATRQQFGAYVYLRDHDLAAESGTSRRLRQPDLDFRERIADELRELAGVLNGDHRHSDQQSDLILEASQVIYWVLLQALREGATWDTLRPDRALATSESQISATTVVRLLRAEAERWSTLAPDEVDFGAAAHATLTLVGQACMSAQLDSLEAVKADIAELESRPYLAPFFGCCAG
jgi:phosphoribosyl-AMP cyclohydrolase